MMCRHCNQPSEANYCSRNCNLAAMRQKFADDQAKAKTQAKIEAKKKKNQQEIEKWVQDLKKW